MKTAAAHLDSQRRFFLSNNRRFAKIFIAMARRMTARLLFLKN
jgi:hypothetical protein